MGGSTTGGRSAAAPAITGISEVLLNYRIVTVLLIGFGIALNGVSASTERDQAVPGLSAKEKIYGLSLFWKEVSYNFAHWETTGELDWDQAYQDFLPRILATENDFDYFQEMQRFCALLKDGHTNVWMPPGLFEKHRDRIPRRHSRLWCGCAALHFCVAGLAGAQHQF